MAMVTVIDPFVDPFGPVQLILKVYGVLGEIEKLPLKRNCLPVLSTHLSVLILLHDIKDVFPEKTDEGDAERLM